MIRVALPYHLRNLARVEGELELALNGPVTLASVLGALEDRHPVLRGAIRDPATGRRRPFVRYFACKQDWSHEPFDKILPDAVATGDEPLLIIGAMAGG